MENILWLLVGTKIKRKSNSAFELDVGFTWSPYLYAIIQTNKNKVHKLEDVKYWYSPLRHFHWNVCNSIYLTVLPSVVFLGWNNNFCKWVRIWVRFVSVCNRNVSWLSVSKTNEHGYCSHHTPKTTDGWRLEKCISMYYCIMSDSVYERSQMMVLE